MQKAGAIYNAGTLTLTADAGDIDFSGNKAADKINDIYTTGSITINGAKNVNITGGFAVRAQFPKKMRACLTFPATTPLISAMLL